MTAPQASLPPRVDVREVGLRDGLQIEAPLPTPDKLTLLDALVATGVRRIEATAFVSPRAVPSMADAEAVMDRVPRPEGVSHIGLVLNRRGYDRAVTAGVDEVNVVVPASDGFAKANQNSTTEALTEVAEEVLPDVEQGRVGEVRESGHGGCAGRWGR